MRRDFSKLAGSATEHPERHEIALSDAVSKKHFSNIASMEAGI